MKKRIEANWDAIKQVEKTAVDKTGDPQAGFNAGTFWFGGDGGRHLMLPILYRGKKGKKGSEQFTTSYKEMMVYANYCPFTGKPLYEDHLIPAKEIAASALKILAKTSPNISEKEAALFIAGFGEAINYIQLHRDHDIR